MIFAAKMSRELAGISAAQAIGDARLRQPRTKIVAAPQRRVGAEILRCQPLDLVSRQHDVPQEKAGDLEPCQRNNRGRVHKRGSAANGCADRADDVDKSPVARARDSQGLVAMGAIYRADCELGKRVERDRLHTIIAAAEDREHRQPSQKEGDVVDQDVPASDDDRRPQDREVDARLADERFNPRFVAVIGQLRSIVSLADADMDDLS